MMPDVWQAVLRSAPLFSTVLFVGLFVAIVIYALSARRSHCERMAAAPLDEEPRHEG